MAIIDYIVIAIAVLVAISGARSGVLSQLGSLVGIVLGVWLVFHFSDQVGQWIGIENVSPIVSYALLFAVGVVAALLVARLLSAIVHGIGLGFFDYIGGALLSLVSFALVASLLLGFVKSLDESMDTHLLEGSVTVPIIEDVADVVFPYLVELKDAVMEDGQDIDLDIDLDFNID